MTRLLCFLGAALVLSAVLVGCSGEDTDGVDARDGAAATDPVCPSFTAAFAGLPDKGEWRTHPAIGDINGDGLGDLVGLRRKGTGPRAFLGDGLGVWRDASSGLAYPAGTSCGIGTRLVDVNGDRSLDLVVADHCRGVLVYEGDGGQTWKDRSKGIPRNMEGFNDADVGDLDGDGLLDIVAISAYQRGFLVLHGKPDGSWHYRRDSGLPDTGSGFELRLRDMNRDGRLDVVSGFNPSIVTRSEPPPAAMIWLQTETGTFIPAQGFAKRARFMGFSTWTRDDGSIDLFFAVVGAEAGVHLYREDAVGSWQEAKRVTGDWFETKLAAHVDVEATDFNGDGCVDLVTTEAHARKLLLAVGNCRDEWRLCPIETLPLNVDVGGWGIATGDLNGDGRPDVAAGFGSESLGGLKAWFQTGASQFSSQGHTAPVTRPALALGGALPTP